MVERRGQEQKYGRRPPAAPGLVLIKSNGRRSVHRDSSGSPPRIIKQFHAPGLAGLLDGHRARRELAGARSLVAAGIPTPEHLGIERIGGHPALVTECIEPAWTLGEILHGRSGPGRVAALRAAARLLVQMEHSGCIHPDLHPGNVLVSGERPAAMLLDVRGVQLGRLSPGAFDGQLAHVAATLRDGAPRAWGILRARFERASGVDRERERWCRIEDDARRQRLDMTHRRLRVWRRGSAETDVVGEPGSRVVRVRTGRVPTGRVPTGAGPPERTHGTRAEVDAAWRVLTLAAMHALPAARPVALALDGTPWFECTRPAPVASVRPASEAPESLMAEVRDRGLRIEGSIEVDAGGAAWIGPRGRLVRVL